MNQALQIAIAFITGSGVVLAWYKFIALERKGPRFAVTCTLERVRLPVRVREAAATGEMELRNLESNRTVLALQERFSVAAEFCHGLESVVHLSIKNVGDRPAEQTSLQTDEKGWAEVRRGASVEVTPFDGKVGLGDILQQETVDATLWIEAGKPRRRMHIIHSLDTQPIVIRREPLYDWRVFAGLTGFVTFTAVAMGFVDTTVGLQNYHLNFLGTLSMILMVVFGVVAGIVAGLGIERSRNG